MTAQTTVEPGGRSARRPRDIPLREWWQILKRVQAETGQDNIGLVAAGIAFYGMLAVFPAIVVLVTLYGLVADPEAVQRQVAAMSGVVPENALAILERQMTDVASAAQSRLTYGLAIALALALWSASAGVKAMMTALNIAYDEQETRGFIWFNVLGLLLTIGAVVAIIVTLALIVALPAIIGLLPLGSAGQWLVSVARWPILLVLVIFGMGVLYRLGPCRRGARWQWLSPGAAAATVLWIIASLLFSWYVSSFASYNETYGSLGAAIILLMWFYISAYVLLLGAELNAELERHTRHDTTVGEDRPMGQRGATVADETAGKRQG